MVGFGACTVEKRKDFVNYFSMKLSGGKVKRARGKISFKLDNTKNFFHDFLPKESTQLYNLQREYSELFDMQIN